MVQPSKGQTLQVISAGGAIVKKATWATNISALNIENQDLVSHRLGESRGLGKLVHFASTASKVFRRDRSDVRPDELKDTRRQVICR